MSTVNEARQILNAFGFDHRRTNNMAARTLMALAGVDTETPWSAATGHRLGVRAIMDWMRTHLSHPIAENSRETVRRFVLHQFVDVGFCLFNDDHPSRPTNSSKNVYRLNPEAVLVLRRFGTSEFSSAVSEYLSDTPSLIEKYASPRSLTRIPVTLPNRESLDLKAGGQNTLIKAMIEDFCGYFVPGGEVLYVGDADAKLLVFHRDRLAELGVHLDDHGKFPDLIVYQPQRHWLFLMEACSTHGPIDHIRYSELSQLFAASSAGLVFVSCFPDRRTMRRFLPELAWDTEAWLASDPTHMIHLNGHRFLGPAAATDVGASGVP